MKNSIKVLSLLLFFVILSSSFPTDTSAQGLVSFTGNAEHYVYTPGTEHSPTDLFTDFKDLMPGDSVSQKILIKSEVSRKKKVNVYLRSLGGREEDKELLSQMTLTVEQVGGNKLFKASAYEKAQLEDWVFLGTVYSGGDIVLDLTLNVPIELGDEHQNSLSHVDWQFRVDEFEISPDDPLPPPTGDSSNMPLWIILLTVSAIILFIVLLRRRRKAKDDD